MNTTLVIMAAGIGSRFGGGVKQLTPVGPNGEIIIDYSIHDALEAGFNKIVFIIRKDIEEDFREVIGDRIEKICDVEYVFQSLDDLPEGFEKPADRTKPWGTGQAVRCCKGIVNEPFAVINADDYYGKEAFRLVHDYLVKEESPKQNRFNICMAGFILKNTLSENGGVTRGICRLNEHQELIGVDETKNIVKTPKGAAVMTEEGKELPVDSSALVSMNFWGFTPEFLEELDTDFQKFLRELPGDGTKAEYLLPTIVDQLLKENRADVSVLKSRDRWFGITYKEDVPSVKADFQRLLEEGVYPAKLWQ